MNRTEEIKRKEEENKNRQVYISDVLYIVASTAKWKERDLIKVRVRNYCVLLKISQLNFYVLNQ